MMILTLALAAAPFVQDVQGSQGEPERKSPLTTDLVMQVFRPTNLQASELYRAVEPLMANQLDLWDTETERWVSCRSLELLGNRALVLYDLPTSIQRNAQILADLDAQVLIDMETDSEAVSLETYHPRYLTLRDAQEALQPFNPQYSQNGEVEVFSEDGRGTLTLRGPESEVALALKHLGELDHPRAQVTITCYLVSEGDSGSRRVPDELAAGLTDLTGIEVWSRRGFAMIRTGVDLGEARTIRLEDQIESTSYELELLPAAFDESSGDVTFSSCSLVRLAGHPQTLFRTSATVSNGEFTALGATGEEPMFLVLQCKTQVQERR